MAQPFNAQFKASLQTQTQVRNQWCFGKMNPLLNKHLCDTYHTSVYAFKRGELADCLNKMHSICINIALKFRETISVPFLSRI